MSKKVVRVRKVFAKQWLAVISGSLFAMSIQSAQASSERHIARLESHNSSLQDFHRHQHATPSAVHAGHLNSSNLLLDQNGAAHKPVGSSTGSHHMRHQTVQGTVDGDIVKLNSGVNLDLGASDTNITLGQKLFNKADSVTISVGGQQKTFSAGAQVSAAEYLAVKQVLAGGGQKVIIDAQGRAAGGEVDLSAISGGDGTIRASNLVIPENVTTYGVFSRGSEFRLTGDLDNYGSVYALGDSRNGGTIHAEDITNHSGALISSIAPAGAHWHQSNGDIDLALRADGILSNSGAITAGGNLSLDAGVSLNNAGTISGKHDISFNAPTMINGGTVESLSGNINLNGLDTSSLQVNNQGGQLSAQNGAINLRDAGYAGNFNTYLSGGDLFSKEFNINSGNASAFVSVGQVSGQINQTGLAVHVDAASDVMTIGNVCLTGDPTYRNTIGSINITGDITVAEALVIAAAGDITTNPNVTISAGDAVTGYPITLIAGVNFISAVGGADAATLPPLPAGSNITLALNSLAGGSIILGNGTTINARSTDNVGNDKGGNVLLIAMQGVSPFAGQVSTIGSNINTGGKNNGANGNVDVIAAGKIFLGSINTQGGDPNTGGDVTVTTAQPFPSKAGLVSYNASGTLTSVDQYVPGTTSGTSATVSIGGALTARSLIVLAGGDLLCAAAVNCNSSVDLTSNANVQTGNILNADVFSADAGDSFSQSSGSINASTILLINAKNNITGTSATLMSSPLISLKSFDGKIGTGVGSRLRIETDLVSVTADNGSVYVSDGTDLGIISGIAGNTLDVVAVDTLTAAAGAIITADVVNLRSSADGIAVQTNISAGTSATLHAVTDIVSNGVASVNAQNVSLSADTGSIGSILTPQKINADNVVIQAPLGGASVSDPDVLNFGGGNTFVGATLTAFASTSVSNSSIVSGNIVLVSGNTVNLAAPVIATTSLGVISSTTLTNTNISGGLSSPFIALASSNGNIGTSSLSPLVIDTAKLGFSAVNGSVFVKDPSALELAGANIKNAFSLVVGGDLSVTGNTTVGGAVSITADGAITGDAGVSVSGSSIALSAKGNIGGDAGHRFHIISPDMTVNTTGSAIFVDNANATAVILNASAAADTLDIATTAADLNSSANFGTKNLFLTSGGVFNFSGTLINNGQISLTSKTDLTNTQFTGLIQTNLLHLGSTAGNVGVNFTNPFVVNNGQITSPVISTSTGTGDVNIKSNSSTVELTNSNSAGDLSVASAGGLSVTGNITAGDHLNLTATNTTLAVANGVALTAVSGISLVNNGTNKKTDKLTIGKDAVITTSAAPGDVIITLGVAGGKAKKPPKNVKVVTNTGTVTFFGKGLTAAAPLNTITGKSANVVISNSLGAKNMTLGGNVTITADPPVPAGSVDVITWGGKKGSMPVLQNNQAQSDRLVQFNKKLHGAGYNAAIFQIW